MPDFGGTVMHTFIFVIIAQLESLVAHPMGANLLLAVVIAEHFALPVVAQQAARRENSHLGKATSAGQANAMGREATKEDKPDAEEALCAVKRDIPIFHVDASISASSDAHP